MSAGAIVFQWREMRKGGIDTGNIAAAANQQVLAANRFASSADKINIGVNNAVVKLGQQADDSETFFRTDERAWVVVGKIEKIETLPPDPPFGTTFKFSVYPANTGKTVARDVRIHLENVNTWIGFTENERAIKMSQDQLFHEQGTGKRFTMPDNPGPETLAPGQTSPVPVYTGGQEPKLVGKITSVEVILGRIDYTDAFNTRHWTHFCYFVANSRGELGHCKYGNDQDGDPENPARKGN